MSTVPRRRPPAPGRGSGRPPAPDGAQQHRAWLALVDVGGPFLSLPVLRTTWPTLDPLDRTVRDRLRLAHTIWLTDPAAGQQAWVRYVLGDLLGWGDALRDAGLDPLAVEVAEHDTRITPSFALTEPGSPAAGAGVKPDPVRLLGLVCPAGTAPTARVPGSAWAATTVDRLAHLCRHHAVELGLATDGRWWALVWAPRGGVTTTAVFDAVSWPETAERDVVRAFVSLLCRRRFFGVPEAERLVPLLRSSLDSQEDITEALGVQVRQAVELLVAAIGRADVDDRRLGGPGLAEVGAHEVYRAAVVIMMRLVFLLFAEERGLLPSDNDLYAAGYSAGGLLAGLEQRAIEGTEEELEHTYAAWHRLLALFNAVYRGIDHPRLTLHGHDGSLFAPDRYPWLPATIDDRTVLHMLRAVQRVQIGTGRSRETRTLSFRTLDVEQIGYVYEGLLSFEGFRASDVTVGLVGKLGLEEEVTLTALEDLAVRAADVPALAAALAERFRESGIGSPKALEKRLSPLDGVEREEARKRLLAVTGGDYPLAERLLPFAGIVRSDLRGLPVVILPGALYVTESALRRNTGTHYTPRFLAEEVVTHALEPLVYAPGPLQTADTSVWVGRSAAEILALKVADIAMGSAAFLVAAARYLGERLIEAWSREGHAQAQAYLVARGERVLGADEDPLVIEARRQIIEHCLYGVDINEMAVEMAKLSLWLVSMDPQRPFTFLDDRLVAGDSLLGIGNVAALPPEAARDLRLERDLAHVLELRRRIADAPDTDEGLARKRELLREAHERTERARAYADLVSGAALAGAKANRDALDRINARLGMLAVGLRDGEDVAAAQVQARAWLRTDHVPGSFERTPLHWPLEFPEVFDRGGFDAIIGNPPFLGGSKISVASGGSYREYLVRSISMNSRGKVDLVAYFLLRGFDLLGDVGQIGVVATNTLAQGETAGAGLSRIVGQGGEIRAATSGAPWPSRSANLEYCVVWITRNRILQGAERILNGQIVRQISPYLGPISRVVGSPYPLAVNKGGALLGSKVRNVDAFTMLPDEAAELINADSRYGQVLFPYLTGKDLNSNKLCEATRWVINFHDWELDMACSFPLCHDRIKAALGECSGRWWQYDRRAVALYEAIKGRDYVFALAEVSSTGIPAVVDGNQVFSHKVVVFTNNDLALFSLLSSNAHWLWSTRPGMGTMRTDPSYTPSDAFETLALPELTAEMRELGDRLDRFRRDGVMLARQAGLTATYNLVNDPQCTDDDIVELRRIHRAIDEAVCRAYGWDDLLAQGLDHGFHAVGRETRYTVGPILQRELVDRLLELNHECYAAEVAAGLHDKKKGRAKPAAEQKGLF